VISGTVESLEALIHLTVRGHNKSAKDFRAVVDTGYNGFLTLPPDLIKMLDLHWRSTDDGTLADGSSHTFDAYDGEVFWDGKWRHIIVDESDVEPLVGMAMLEGHELRMHVHDNGQVEIARLV
jgi:clan AA aspartic protease